MTTISIRKLVFWPAVITFLITLLRLTGELMHWSTALFSPAAGGGGALVGISWLPPLFGIWFALKLVRAGLAPASGGRAIAMAVAGVATTAALMAVTIAMKLIRENEVSLTALLLFAVVMGAGAVVAWWGWPALGQTMLAYALAARIPVALVMLVAMMASWGTHYDVAPPGFPEMGVFSKWLLIGALPQLTVWLAFTVITGMLAGSIAGAVAMRGRAPVTPPVASTV
jgi:hypothetical protein